MISAIVFIDSASDGTHEQSVVQHLAEHIFSPVTYCEIDYSEGSEAAQFQAMEFMQGFSKDGRRMYIGFGRSSAEAVSVARSVPGAFGLVLVNGTGGLEHESLSLEIPSTIVASNTHAQFNDEIVTRLAKANVEVVFLADDEHADVALLAGAVAQAAAPEINAQAIAYELDRLRPEEIQSVDVELEPGRLKVAFETTIGEFALEARTTSHGAETLLHVADATVGGPLEISTSYPTFARATWGIQGHLFDGIGALAPSVTDGSVEDYLQAIIFNWHN